MTVAGIALGIAAVSSTLGVAATAAGAVSDRFDALEATMVTVRYPKGAVPPDAGAAGGVGELNGVESAGLLCAGADQMPVGRVAAAVEPPTQRANVLAIEPSALRTLGVRLVGGREFDDGHGARGDAVALLDTTMARRLGVTDPAAGRMVWVGGLPLTVLGVVAPPAGDPRLTGAVFVPYQVCRTSVSGTYTAAEVVIRTRIGAAAQVGTEAPLALDPRRPRDLAVAVPPGLDHFRQGVESDNRSLLLGLAAVSLVIGALGVSNTTSVSVMERRAEIGLRRAIGATRRAVAGQFLTESGLLGFAGGLLGTVIGVNVTAAVAIVKGWIVALDPIVLAGGPVMGLAIGMLAGLYPAWAASRIAPAGILRGE
ncbi:FtsX-like permease family protein [Actinoplanes sp. NPDC051861]|uniref:ABC transporter permease n=1 Tax=Actinoplanes sp. NPDC051861 TaxID=3155170 RepID=UPI00343CB317